MQTFDKEAIKKSIIDNVKNQFRKTIDEATPQQVYQAVAYAVKDVIIDNWIATQKTFDDLKVKKVYYLSMEFLMGRALGNNIINLGEQKEIREALEAGSGSWQRRSWPSGSLLSGFSCYAWIPGLWLRYPLPLRHVQAEN